MRKLKESMWNIIIALIIFVIIIGISFSSGWLGNRYEETITKENINIKRENFEQSKSRLHGLADDLAKYKYELTTEENEIARKAIIEMIIDRTSSLDPQDLEDPSLTQFVIDIKNGKYN